MMLVDVGLKEVLISAYCAIYIIPWEGRLFDISGWKGCLKKVYIKIIKT